MDPLNYSRDRDLGQSSLLGLPKSMGGTRSLSLSRQSSLSGGGGEGSRAGMSDWVTCEFTSIVVQGDPSGQRLYCVDFDL